MKGAFVIEPSAAQAKAFAASYGGNTARLPHTLPILALAAPAMKEQLRALAVEHRSALIHESQTVALDRPLDIDHPLHVDYTLTLREGPPMQARIEAAISDEWGRRFGTLSTLLRLIPLPEGL